MNGLSIVICTRNRPIELDRCISSIIDAEPLQVYQRIELLIVDDGALPSKFLERIQRLLVHKGIEFRYIQKFENHGLFYSRIVGIKNSLGEIILFLDDDVEIERDYIIKLREIYNKHPEIGGFGGIDIILKTTWYYRVYNCIFLLRSRNIGKLSISFFSGSCLWWLFQKKAFYTEFLMGHNMSFKKKYLSEIPEVTWFKGYSIGEDIFLSHLISQKALLLLDPDLRVKHYPSKVSRDVIEITKRTHVINHFLFLKFFKSPWWKYVFSLWSYTGIILRHFIRQKKLGSPKGYVLGLKDVYKLIRIQK